MAKILEKRKKFGERFNELVRRRKRSIRKHFDLAGLTIDSRVAYRRLFNVSVFFTLLISIYTLFRLVNEVKPGPWFAVILLAIIWTLVFVIVAFVVWFTFFFYLDYRIYERTKKIEEILPEFLQLTAANIKAGMPVDRAMWFALRPKFGVFTREIEDVAKSTFTGEDFSQALEVFGEKYDSIIVRRSVNLLIEGIDAGGELADLLTRIADDITEVKILKKDMTASVTTYIIFISVATVIAAPLLFALSTQLIGVISSLTTAVSATSGSTAGISNIGFSFSQVAIEKDDFRIFSLMTLGVTSFFASAIVATVKKGSIKGGLKYIPIFIISSLVFYLLLSWLLEGAFSAILVT